ncbi:uncharacterized protein MYCFIDRAFT_85887 [Pseudocercospora fijiensis CIRAD86]|uniref:Uncharacterized protein n=1 Tax=Pseudocercospora fijiensis (strain CIRAD86) TaxID=383855 RepID=N1Q6F5_PSEFD|nr:uncharacterized protein MYCFIDRAFT_85887 [Pseudocercospora fijiensis CIRAD86]EME87914.1 hypothetical protein MYCFIDRAFT_85887 [Pseudocercospora fijiensis CIRAD86]
MHSILISGAASGLGAAFVAAYAQQRDVNIIAIDRRQFEPAKANIRTYVVDIASQDSINQFAKAIENESISVLIHSAGIRGLVPAVEDEHPDDVHACETLQVMDFETMTRAFTVNTTGTFMLLRALVPHLRRAHGKVIVMSSRMGSIGNNQHPNKDAGSAYAYRASKAALNMVVRSFAADEPEVVFVLCHPGRVETSLVRCVERGAITAEESIAAILPLVEKWTHLDSGRFYDRFGQAIEW